MRLNVIEVQMIVTIGVCVILPVLIVWIVGRVRQNATNRKAEIILKAMEQQGAEFNPDLIKPLLQKKKSIKRDLVEKLNGACITGMMGIAFLVLMLLGNTKGNYSSYLPFASIMLIAVSAGLFVSYFTGKKMLAKEIEAEEKDLLEEKKGNNDPGKVHLRSQGMSGTAAAVPGIVVRGCRSGR